MSEGAKPQHVFDVAARMITKYQITRAKTLRLTHQVYRRGRKPKVYGGPLITCSRCLYQNRGLVARRGSKKVPRGLVYPEYIR